METRQRTARERASRGSSDDSEVGASGHSLAERSYEDERGHVTSGGEDELGVLSPASDQEGGAALLRPDIRPEPFSHRMDTSVAFVYHPLSIALLAGGTLVALATGYHFDRLPTHIPARLKNVTGAGAAIAAFLLFCMLNFRDSVLRRPHPAVWRIVLGMNLLYFVLLVYLLFQDVEHARELVQTLDPSLSYPLPEKSYAENCDFTLTNVLDGVDIFCLAHALGWFGKAVILRDHTLCWILSIMFEICEYSLQHQLPNFAECWWDHLILDVLLCNWLGIWLGMKCCEFLRVRPFKWQGQRRRGGFRARTTRLADSLLPHDWTAFEWHGTRTFRNYAGIVSILALFLSSELALFYLKALLGIPPEHFLVVGRLALIFLWGLPAVAETYTYVNEYKRIARLGSHAWLALATILLEVVIAAKWSKGQFSEPAPMWAKVFWSLFAVGLAAYPVVKFGLQSRRKRKQR